MYTSIEEIRIKYNSLCKPKYCALESEIIEIFNGNVLKYESEEYKNNDNINFILGLYYHCKEINYDKMKYYYELAVNLNNFDAMNNMGMYYQNIEINYDKMKYYYQLAIDLNNDDAMNNMGVHYKNIEMNYDLMKYFYELAILNNQNLSNITIFNLNKLDQYILLEKLKNKNVTNKYITIESIKKINSYDIVIKYKNKCNILKKIEKCILCLDDGIDCIPLECAHYLCINLDNNCYSNMIYGLDHKCSICKGEILLSNN